MKRNGINVKNETSFLFIIHVLRVANFLSRIPHAVVVPGDGQFG